MALEYSGRLLFILFLTLKVSYIFYLRNFSLLIKCITLQTISGKEVCTNCFPVNSCYKDESYKNCVKFR